MNRHFFARVIDFSLHMAVLIFCLMAASDGPYFPIANFVGVVGLCLNLCILSSWRSKRKRRQQSIPWHHRPCIKTYSR